MDPSTHTVLVTGATGSQGGAVARELLDAGWQVRGLTRDVTRDAARELELLGADMVEGDLDDRDSLDRAVDGCYGVFSVQQFWEHGVEGEVRQGRNLADAAAAADVQHYVQSSVGGAERDTGIPHFDSKWEIEQHLESLDLPVTVLRPVFFMNNFEGMRDSIREGTLSMPLPPDTPLQMIAVRDIGRYTGVVLENPAEFVGAATELAGDELPMDQVAETFSQVLGREVRYEPVSLDAVDSDEMRGMFEWFVEEGYQADIASLRSTIPDLLDLRTWIEERYRNGGGS